MTDAQDGGFAMVEALAAIAVAAIVGAALIAALSSVGNRDAEAKVRELALRQAESLIAEARTTKAAGAFPASGSTAPGLHWTRIISRNEADYSGLERIDVDVRWPRRHKQQGVTHLEAYRVAQN